MSTVRDEYNDLYRQYDLESFAQIISQTRATIGEMTHGMGASTAQVLGTLNPQEELLKRVENWRVREQKFLTPKSPEEIREIARELEKFKTAHPPGITEDSKHCDAVLKDCIGKLNELADYKEQKLQQEFEKYKQEVFKAVEHDPKKSRKAKLGQSKHDQKRRSVRAVVDLMNDPQIKNDLSKYKSFAEFEVQLNDRLKPLMQQAQKDAKAYHDSQVIKKKKESNVAVGVENFLSSRMSKP